MRKRNVQVILRLTPAERTMLQRGAQKAGLSQSAYLRLLLAGHTPREQPPMEYHKLLRELYSIGNNLNQIAARANSTGFIHAQGYAQNAEALRQAVLEIQAALTLPEPCA